MFYMTLKQMFTQENRKIVYGWQYNFTQGDKFGKNLSWISKQLMDQALIERIQKGDQKSFNLLVLGNQYKVVSIISRYMRHGAISAIAHKSFVKAYRALELFRDDSVFMLDCIELL